MLWLDVLRPTSGTPPIDAADVRRCAANTAAVLRKGLHVTAHLEPAGSPAVEWANVVYADPDRRAEWARSNVAPVAAVKLRDGPGGPVLAAAVDDAELPAGERAALRAGRVTCRLDWNFCDDRDGTVFHGLSLSHVAIGLRPDHTYLMSRTMFNMSTTFQTDTASVVASIVSNLAAAGINIPENAVNDLASLDRALRIAVANKTAGGGAGGDDQLRYKVEDGQPAALMSHGNRRPLGKVIDRRSASAKEVEDRQTALARQFSKPKPKKAG